LTKTGLGYILGDFLTNSSGHPGKKIKDIKIERLANWKLKAENKAVIDRDQVE
jgi:hypothetical protein